MKVTRIFVTIVLSASVMLAISAQAQIGRRYPSEKKIVKDPVTGTMLTFLTSTPIGDSKIYQTHPQWTADQHWLIFRSNRARNEAFAVNEQSGDIVQVTEGGYTGMLCLSRKYMKLYYMHYHDAEQVPDPSLAKPGPGTAAGAVANATPMRRGGGSIDIMVVELDKVFADSKAGTMKPASYYQHLICNLPASMNPGTDMALDADENRLYARVGKQEAAKHISPDVKIEPNFGPRNMGAGPSGLVSVNIGTDELKYIVSVPFQIGHIQTNPWVAGEIIFCWETGGKSPQRTWIVQADGTGLRPLYPEAPYEWVTHEAVITKDEVAFALMGHRPVDLKNLTGTSITTDPTNPGQEQGWGNAGTREKPTGLGIVNIRTREMAIIAQTPSGSGLWHVNGSGDGRWAVGDDFSRSVYLIDRHTHEMIMLSTGHKPTAADHTHPTFSPDGTRIEIQSAMLSADNRSMNICIIPVPTSWLARTYSVN